jgi:dienelactone hydrolase
MTSRYLTYDAEGRAFAAEFHAPEGATAPCPGVLVCHAGDGLSDHTRGRARRLAKLGYAAMAPDLYGEVFADRAAGAAAIGALVGDAPRFRARLLAAFAAMRGQPQVDPARCGAIGFCFGGTAVLELARAGADAKAVVAFHGGLRTAAPAAPDAIKGAVLALVGSHDPFIDAPQREAFAAEMTAAGADWTLMLIGGALHGFAHEGIDPAKSPGSAYDARADQRSWAAMQVMFAETLGPRA